MSPVLGIIASSNQQGRGTAVGSYDALAAITVPSGGLSSISFAGIPVGYRQLQFRILARTTSGTATNWMGMQFNGDSSNSYGLHQFVGFGSGTPSSGYNGLASLAIIERLAGGGAASGVFGAIIVDILNYSSTTKTKTVRSLGGVDSNSGTTAGSIYYESNLWNNTSAISSVVLSVETGNFAQNSTVALYGVK
jgi:hypothetical protein